MLAKLIVVMCFWGAAPDDEVQCDPPFQIPVQMTMQQCMLFGQHAALEYVQRYPYFEFMELREWRCEAGELA